MRGARYGYLAALLVLAAGAAPVLAQQRVTFSFVEGFEDGLPLDVPFLIVGEAPDGVTEIAFRYGPETGAGCAPGDRRGQRWVAAFGDEFAFEVAALRPWTRYAFCLTFELELGLLDEARPGLLDGAVDLLVERIEDGVLEDGGISRAEQEAIVGDLLALLLPARSGYRLLPALDPRLGPDAVAEAVRAAGNETLENRDFAADEARICEALRDAFDEPWLRPVDDLLTGLVAGDRSDALTPSQRAVWASRIDPGDPRTGTTVEDLAALVITLFRDDRPFEDIVDGRATVVRGSVLENPGATGRCEAGDIDEPGLAVVEAFLEQLVRMQLPELEGGGAPSLLRGLENLAAQIHRLRDASRRLAAARDRTTLRAALRAVALRQTIASTAVATESADRDHPYVGMDLGVGYLPAAADAFFFTAANVYSVPVNKDGHLDPIFPRSGYDLRKRLSLTLGLAVTGIEESGEREELWGIGSPMLGLGYRLARDVRLTGGLIWYRQEVDAGAGPVETTRRSWYASLSVDIDVASFIGNLGRVFGAS